MGVFSFDGIGTRWWLECLDGKFDATTKGAVQNAVQRFDDQYSRFKDNSLIGRLNRTGGLKNPPDELLKMFAWAREMYQVSDGAFDISVGGVLHAQGYGSRRHANAIAADFWDHCIYTKEKISLPKDCTIDNGGYGKGWLVDAIVALLRSRGYKNFIVNGGGDLYVASHTPIEIALEHPYDSSQKIGSVRLQNQALAVSGISKRHWSLADANYHHIVDPFTGDSLKSNVAGTYVQAITATIADSVATILLLRPDLKDMLCERYRASARVVTNEQLQN